jgi:hypothetical protein
MATPQLSPGIITREVDLTVGRAENVLDNIGAIAGPFPLGPVEEPINITTEQELINVFGKPISTDSQYEYWMSASSYLSYGGILKVVRCDGDSLQNSNSGIGSESTDVKIKNFDDYNENYSDDSADFYFASKNPGSWANGLKVCLIDDAADQILSGINTSRVISSTFNPVIASRSGIIVGSANTVAISTASIAIGQEVSCATSNVIPDGTTVTGISTENIITLSQTSLQLGNVTGNFTFGNTVQTTTSQPLEIGYTITQSLDGTVNPGIGTTSILDGNLKGIITGIGLSEISVKIASYVSGSEVETEVDYQKSGVYAFKPSGTVGIITDGTNDGDSVSSTYTSRSDWYDQQTLELKKSIIYWKNIAPKPVTNGYSLDRNGKGDALHIVVVDDNGSVTGIQANILEKHLFLSKATDAISGVNSPQKIWYKNYLANNSSYIFAGKNPSISEDTYHKITPLSVNFDDNSSWNALAQGTTFNAIGNVTYELLGGVDYTESNGMMADLSGLISAYQMFSNVSNVNIDFLIYGPGLDTLERSQAKANALISIAETRKDCMAVISPWSQAVVNQTNAETQTQNIIQFFTPLNSSSYSVFDCGYKFTYDRFNNKFRYIPCNADVAGLMARTGVNSYPWFSPAGQQRGVLNNAIKLAYNPTKEQRDALYQVRINPITNQPGIGILLYGDRTALGYSSAFDRINVRRLFLTIEQALQKAAQAQLFEFNDQITRSNFVNIIDPYLRDVQAKRGLFDFKVICDESNNTPDVIDNNEFRADIFLKPNRSINYITLTFVATRTGVSFEEVAGRV